MMPRMTVRHMMIAVLYVAVALGMVMAVLRTTGPGRYMAWTAFALWLPMALAFLSAVLLRRGPWRQWLTFSFIAALFFAVGALLFAFPAVVVLIFAGRGGSPRPPVSWPHAVPFGIGSLFFAAAATYIVLDSLIPRFCPRCRRLALINSFGHGRLHRGKRLYLRCEICDHVARLPVVEIAFSRDRGRDPKKRLVSPISPLVAAGDRPACLACGRPTLRRVPYRFYWCLACGSRCKRDGHRPWDDAPSPADDDSYA
jgi:hypothetical protein